MINMYHIASDISKYQFFNIFYVNFTSQCGLLNREKGEKKLLKLLDENPSKKKTKKQKTKKTNNKKQN